MNVSARMEKSSEQLFYLRITLIGLMFLEQLQSITPGYSPKMRYHCFSYKRVTAFEGNSKNLHGLRGTNVAQDPQIWFNVEPLSCCCSIDKSLKSTRKFSRNTEYKGIQKKYWT